jgi:hypothetical protein
MLVLLPIVPRATTGWYLVVPLIIAGCGLGLLVSQLNNYTLSPISEERVSEAAGVNSAAGSFGLSFGLDAEVMSNTQLEEQIAGQPQDIQDEILDINTDARPKALQVALLVPIVAGLLGLANSFRMIRLPDPEPSEAAEGMVMG